VELPQVDVVGSQPLQAPLHTTQGLRFFPPAPLSGEYDFFPASFNSFADADLAVLVEEGCVDEVYSRSRARRITLVASSNDGRVIGMPPIPTLETSKPVFPNLAVLISLFLLQKRWLMDSPHIAFTEIKLN